VNAISPATPLDHAAIQADLLKVKADFKLSWSRLASLSGIPKGTISNYGTGNYDGDLDRVGAEVKKWLDTRGERAATQALLPAAPGFVETATAKRILSLLSFAQSAPDIVVAAGGAGIGKTEAVRQYRRTHPNVHIATMRPTTSGVHTMLGEVATVMCVEERAAARLSRAIGVKVQGAGALLVIDEAQHLVPAALDELRALHDNWGLGIALVGNETVYSRLEGQGRVASLAQLYSRVGMRFTQGKPTADDVRALIEGWGIDDAAIAKTLAAVAAKPGALRGMGKTIKLAVMLAAGDDVPLADRHVRDAWRQLGNAVIE
jgi:DNA transposition AAA+ family ATPase